MTTAVGNDDADRMRALEKALRGLTVCDVCMSVHWGAAWCHDQRTSLMILVPGENVEYDRRFDAAFDETYRR